MKVSNLKEGRYMNLNDVDLEARLFYRLIKVLHIIITIFCFIISCVLSFDDYMFNSLKMIAMTLVIGFSLSYFIPTLIKKTLLYIAYGKKIVVFSDRFITVTSLVSEHVVRVLKIYPTIIYFTGICFFYTLSFLFNTDAFFTLAGLWMLGYPLIKFILLCKKAFIDNSYDAKYKLWDILENTIKYTILACLLAIYSTWKDPKLHYVFEAILKYIKYIWYFFGICYWIYIIWLLIKSLINGAPKAALKILFSNLMVIAFWIIIYYCYDIIKNTDFHLWHMKPFINYFHG